VLKRYGKLSMLRLLNSALCLFLLLPLTANAVTVAKEKAMPVDPMSASSIVNMLMGLGLVLMVIFLMAWLVRRMGGMQISGSQKLRLLGGISLGAREKVVLIQIENKRLVLGVAQGQVNTLHVLDGEYENTENESVDSGSAFKEKLLQALSSVSTKNKTTDK